jgi:hypothetical protein
MYRTIDHGAFPVRNGRKVQLTAISFPEGLGLAAQQHAPPVMEILGLGRVSAVFGRSSRTMNRRVTHQQDWQADIGWRKHFLSYRHSAECSKQNDRLRLLVRIADTCSVKIWANANLLILEGLVAY